MRKISFFLCCLIATSLCFSKDFTKGRGKFKADDDDSYDFIKKQLVHEGFKDIISKELSNLGLNTELFWQKYNSSLEESYAQLEAELKSKYKISSDSSRAQINNYEKELRRKKLIKERSYGGINNIIPRWVVKKISRSQKWPKNRYISIEGDVDRGKLNQFYYSFVKGKQSISDGTLYVKVNFDLRGFSYSDIEIENEKEFDGVISKKWIDWFLINKPPNISNVVLIQGELEQKLKAFQNLPTTDMLVNVPSEFMNSLLLDLNLQLELEDSNPALSTYQYQFRGEAFLKNLQSNYVIETFSMRPETKEYRLAKSSSLANILANHLYQLGRDYFPKVTQSIKNITPIKSIQRVSLHDFQSINNIQEVLDMVSDEGVKYSLRTEIESISQGKADVIFFFDGKIDQIKLLLNQVRVQAAKKGLGFEVVDTVDELGIKFKGDTEGTKI